MSNWSPEDITKEIIKQGGKITDRTIRNHLMNGRLRGEKISGVWIISEQDALEYIEGFISTKARKYKG